MLIGQNRAGQSFSEVLDYRTNLLGIELMYEPQNSLVWRLVGGHADCEYCVCVNKIIWTSLYWFTVLRIYETIIIVTRSTFSTRLFFFN
jgi:hypothetical protein